jgi:hypothetical protein
MACVDIVYEHALYVFKGLVGSHHPVNLERSVVFKFHVAFMNSLFDEGLMDVSGSMGGLGSLFPAVGTYCFKPYVCSGEVRG